MSQSRVVNVFDSFLVWVPTVAIVAAVIWALCLGIMHLEMITPGSEVFVSNAATPNVSATHMDHPVNTTTEEGVENLMVDALSTGSLAEMQAVFARHNA